jgi:hypothetical protein
MAFDLPVAKLKKRRKICIAGETSKRASVERINFRKQRFFRPAHLGVEPDLSGYPDTCESCPLYDRTRCLRTHLHLHPNTVLAAPNGPAKASSRLHQNLAPRDVAWAKGGKSELLKSRAAWKIARQMEIRWPYGAKSLQVYKHRMIPVFADARRERF